MTAPAALRTAPMRLLWRELQSQWAAVRDRLLTAPSFHVWASRSPLLRHVARREAQAMFDLCAGFVYSQILLAVVRLDVFELLKDGPLPAASLEARLPLPADGVRRLVDAAVALKLLERRSRNRIGLGSRGAVFIANPGLREMVLHHELMYADLADPLALLRGEPAHTRLADYWAYARAQAPDTLNPGAVAPYSNLMAMSQDMVSQTVIDAYDFSAHTRLLDVGGGEGRFVSNVLRATPGLLGTVFDLPAVATRAEQAFARHGLASRACAQGGNFLDSVPATDADVVTLVRVLHDHDDAPALRLLRNLRAAMAPGSTLLVAEPMIEQRSGDVVSAAYFGMYLTAMRSGRPRTTAEVAAMLEAAGFGRISIRRAHGPLPLCLVQACPD